MSASDCARDADAALDDALRLLRAPREPGNRQRHRAGLERAIALAERALALAEQSPDATPGAGPTDLAEVAVRASTTLARAHAARAEDARYGAGQLARGSQRAPTVEDCEDGWERVEEIVGGAEDSARQARRAAQRAGNRRADAAARAAETAARLARGLVDDRNDAYTFHADPGFSFGEGWYVAAAGLLAGIEIQIEPGKRHTAAAEHFARAVGLSERLVPYRPRPRANKHLTGIVAREFARDPGAAQRALRSAFLGDAPPSPAIAAWTEQALAGAAEAEPGTGRVLLWVRHSGHHPNRNTTDDEIAELARRAREASLVPVLFGDALRDTAAPEGSIDLTLCWKEPLFQGVDMRRAQLQLFESLRCDHGLVGQVGVTTAGMDGPALLGLPTLYITREPNPRMGRWVGAIPGYQEIVRDRDYLERIAASFRQWAE